MATHQIAGQRWPDGTTVSVYPAAAWTDQTRAPSGTAVTTAAVSGGAVTFSGLSTKVRYVAYAAGTGITFMVPVLEPSPRESLRTRLDELQGSELPDVSRLLGMATYVEGPPTGVSAHDTALVQQALASAPGNSSDLMLGDSGDAHWQLDLGTLGSTTAGQGVAVRIGGFGPYATVIGPKDATSRIFKIQAPGDSSSDYFELDNIGVCLPADRAYDVPLIEVAIQKGQINITERVRFFSGSPTVPETTVSYTGTALKLDGAYEGRCAAEFRMGKHAVPLEFVNTSNAPVLGIPPNLDSFEFSGSINGVHGHVFRNAYSQVHGLGFSLKHTNTVFYPTPPFGEAGIATGGASAGASSVKVNTAMVAGTMPVNGDAIGIDFGDKYEVAKVNGAPVDNGDGTTSLPISTTLRFAHVAAMPVIVGGKSLSFGDRYTAINVRYLHAEGPYIGISAAKVRGINILSGFNNCAELVRLEDETRNVFLAPAIESQGTPGRHTLIRKAPYSTAAAGTWGGHVAYDPVPPHTIPGWYITPTVFGNTGNSYIQVKRDSSAGVMTTLVNINPTVADRGLSAFEVQVSGTATAYIRYGGKAKFPAIVLSGVNTTGLTSAQIDTAIDTLLTGSAAPVTHAYEDGMQIVDTTNFLLLIRAGGKWYKSAALTLIA